MGKIQYLVMDVDGTLTDGKIYMGKEEELFKTFDIKDGYGIKHLLIPGGIEPIVITGRSSEIVERRCKELDIKLLFQGVSDKNTIISRILCDKKCDLENIAYIGDDLIDLSCMILVKKNGGIVGCPANAVKEVRDIADFVSAKNGGEGAVRDFIEFIIAGTTSLFLKSSKS